jgi:hypothetical protein
MLRAMQRLVWTSLALSLLGACAYPRHTTNLAPLPPGRLDPSQQPKGMYTMRLIDATLTDRQLSGLPWDDDGSAPDPFVRLYIDHRMVWQSPVIHDAVNPEWNAVLPENVIVKPDSPFRLDVLDWDTAVSADPIARLDRMGLPVNALPDAIARVQIDPRVSVTMLVTAPRAYQGVGVRVELRPGQLVVIAVEPYSPAARAGIKVGEIIVGVGNERVSAMSDQEAASSLSLASERSHKLAVTDAEGKNEREVTLDKGYVWLVL